MLQDSERPGYNKEEAATRATAEGGNGGLNGGQQRKAEKPKCTWLLDSIVFTDSGQDMSHKD